MRSRDDRDGLAGDVDGKAEAALIHRRDVGFDECFGLMADVQVDAINAQALHLMVNGAGDDIARRQFTARIKAVHESLAIWQF